MLKLFILLLALTLMVFFYWLLCVLNKTRLQTLQRLEVYGDVDYQQRIAANQEGQARREWRELLSIIGMKMAHVTPRRFLDWLERDLARAGIPLRGDELVSISLGLALLTGFSLFLVAASLTSGLLGLGIGLTVPFLLVKRRIASRLKALESELGDILLFLANALKAGHSFMQALQLAAKETRPPFSHEVSKVLREINLGVTVEEALLNMVERLPSDDLDLVVTVVLIQRRIGGNLAEILENIAGTIRERLRLRKEVKTLTAQSRLSGIIIGLIPVVVGGFLFALNPTYMMPLFTHPLGVAMIIAAAASEIVGLLVIKRMIRIEV